MKKIVKLTESDLVKLVKRVINEQTSSPINKKIQDFYTFMFTNLYTQFGNRGFNQVPSNITNIAKDVAGIKGLQLYRGKVNYTSLNPNSFVYIWLDSRKPIVNIKSTDMYETFDLDNQFEGLKKFITTKVKSE
jgi:hypothetical protein